MDQLRIKVVHRWHELESRGSDLSSENELKKMLSSIISQYDKRLLALEQNQAHEQRIQALEKNQAHEQRIQILEKNQEHTVNPRVTSWEKTHYELTEEDIFNIYLSTNSFSELSTEYFVSPVQILNIKNGSRYTNITRYLKRNKR